MLLAGLLFAGVCSISSCKNNKTDNNNGSETTNEGDPEVEEDNMTESY